MDRVAAVVVAAMLLAVLVVAYASSTERTSVRDSPHMKSGP